MRTVEILQALIQCPSVTPVDAGAQDYLADILTELGFECHRLPFGEGEDHVPNLFARLGIEGPHFCYAGHTDVVPTGPEEKWTHPPFAADIKDGVLYGRGASDMKGSIAAFAAAVENYLKDNKAPKGSISLLITGDEEGPAINGTVKVLEWMKENNHIPDVCLVGEPTNPDTLGQEVKIGRRGSLSGKLKVTGKQGHVAYQEKADNPLPRLAKLLDALASHEFDAGTEFFPATNLEITSIDVGNPADNVIPGQGEARFNIRFNDQWNADGLSAKIRDILDAVSKDYDLDLVCGAESFLTQPGDFSDLIVNAVSEATGKTPALTTNGGTSDARFVQKYCPVAEFGGINATVHQIDENADVVTLEQLTDIYQRILSAYFS